MIYHEGLQMREKRRGGVYDSGGSALEIEMTYMLAGSSRPGSNDSR
jgi:hypothetical protein